MVVVLIKILIEVLGNSGDNSGGYGDSDRSDGVGSGCSTGGDDGSDGVGWYHDGRDWNSYPLMVLGRVIMLFPILFSR